MSKGNENPLDKLVDFAADQLLTTVTEVPDDAPPFGSRKLSAGEQAERYGEIRGDPQAWAKLLDGHGLKEVIDYALRMEPLYQEWHLEQEKEAQQLS